jgi:ParB family chromosome partitioning protein
MRFRLDAVSSVPRRFGGAGGNALPAPFDAPTPAQGEPTSRPAVQTIALDRLALTPSGRRKINPRCVEALASKIEAAGSVQSLAVVPGEDFEFYVVAGDCRFAALQLLAEQGRISTAFPVPCRVITSSTASRIDPVTDRDSEPSSVPPEKRRRFLSLRNGCRGLLTGSELAARQAGVTAI